MKAKTMQRAFLREAAVMLIFARLAVHFLPPARLFAWANRPPCRINRFAVDEATWISWAIESVSARAFMNAHCLPRALAAHAMLRRRGIASRLCLGVARQKSEVIAHAWVEIDQDKIIGGAEADRFTPLAEFGRAY